MNQQAKSMMPYRSEKVYQDGSRYKGYFVGTVPQGVGRLDY